MAFAWLPFSSPIARIALTIISSQFGTPPTSTSPLTTASAPPPPTSTPPSSFATAATLALLIASTILLVCGSYSGNSGCALSAKNTSSTRLPSGRLAKYVRFSSSVSPWPLSPVASGFSSRFLAHALQNHSASATAITRSSMGGSWHSWWKGVLQPSQKTIMLLCGLWPRWQILQMRESWMRR